MNKIRTFFVISLIAILLIVVFAGFSCSKGESKQQYDYGVFIGAGPEDLHEMEAYNTIVIDAQYFSEDDISKLKQEGHIVYTYLNIGSVEAFRDYQDEYESITLDSYENWEDEKWVDVSNEGWQSFIVQKADELLSKGVDGFFVDNCDVYYQYPNEEIFYGLSNILEDLKNRGGYILNNGGDIYVTEFYNRHSTLDAILDGVNQESVYTCIDWDNESFGVNSDEDRDYFSNYLNMVLDDDKDAYVIEYADNIEIAKAATHYDYDNNFRVYVSNSLELKQ